MIRFEVRICKRCGRPYTHTRGGIIFTPEDKDDCKLCDFCKKGTASEKKKIFKKFYSK